MPRRRELLRVGAGLIGLALAPGTRLLAAPPRFGRDPFTLGVASGEPDDRSVVLWTRLAPEPLADDGGLAPIDLPVTWEVAEDDSFRRVVASGEARAEAAWAHAVHVEVGGLAPDRWYAYRFRCGEALSPVGRTRTLPAPGAAPSSLRFVAACCQNYEDGHYAAWRAAAQDAPDFVVHLGDYIYEMAIEDGVRRHARRHCLTLAEYRVRHAQYRLDPALAQAHAAAPWFVTWDDHDVQNDYAGDHAQDFAPAEAFRRRRAAAYQAYWEHLPLRSAARPQGAGAALYRRARLGSLATLHLLDSRQYRDDQACPLPDRGGARLIDDVHCATRRDPRRTLLGAAQERWLEDGLAEPGSRWNLLAQQLLMTPLDQKPGPGQAWWSDGWDGYPAARERLLRAAARPGVADTLVLGGDIHAFWAADLALGERVVASELTATSISSRGIPHERFRAMLPDNPAVRFFDARYRGYVRCTLDAASCKADFVAVDDVTRPDSGTTVLESFVVEAGRPGVRLA